MCVGGGAACMWVGGLHACGCMCLHAFVCVGLHAYGCTSLPACGCMDLHVGVRVCMLMGAWACIHVGMLGHAMPFLKLSSGCRGRVVELWVWVMVVGARAGF